MNALSSAVAIAFAESVIRHRLAKADVFPEREVEHGRVLEHESYLLVQACCFVLVDVPPVELDGAGGRLEQPRKEIE